MRVCGMFVVDQQIFYSPCVFGLQISVDGDASGLSKVALHLEGGVAGGHQLWVVLHDDNVGEDVTVLEGLALAERELHRE